VYVREEAVEQSALTFRLSDPTGVQPRRWRTQHTRVSAAKQKSEDLSPEETCDILVE
jgi:hypothetical protein